MHSEAQEISVSQSHAGMDVQSFQVGADKRQQTICDRLDLLTKAADDLHNVFSDLHERLGPVLGPEEPLAVAGELKKMTPSSEIAGRLDELGGVLDSLRARFHDVLRRVEL